MQAQVSLAKYPQETENILHCDTFWFFLKDEEFVSKTINDSNIDLEKFPASKVKQLAKKMEASKVTGHHIKQVASDPQAAQINLMRHQCTDLRPRKHKKKQSFKSRPPSTSGIHVSNNKCHPTRRSLILNKPLQVGIAVPSVGIPDMWKVSIVLPRSFSVKLVTSMVISQACVTRNQCLLSPEHPKHISYKLNM